MAEYRKLLYSIGGGIISDAQLDAQNGSATIVIGLGGTGKDAIKCVKNEVYKRIAPDNPGEAISRYSHIKYLSIDTDKSHLWDDDDFIGIDINSEFFSIEGDVNIFTDEKHTSILANQPYAKWLSCRNIRLQSTQGAGGVRQIGRYFFIDKSNSFSTKLDNIFTSAVSNANATGVACNDVNIHIMSGLGGGTGAGILLDTCYLIRRAIDLCNALVGKNVKICGYFFMPDVNLSKISTDSVKDYVMYNSFATMKELDYCMNMVENGDKWRQHYNGFEIETSNPPVDICYLVSSQSLSANVIKNGYAYAMGVVSDYVVQFISNNAINMDTHIANYARAETQLPKQHGGNYKYVVIGGSHSIVPMREISTYLASMLFGRMTAAWSNEPTDQNIVDFCEKLGLSCEALRNDVGGYSVAQPEIDNDFRVLPSDDSGDKYTYGYVLPEKILGPFNKIQHRICGETLKKGHDALINNWKYGMELDDKPISIVCRVFKALDEVVRDPHKGPIYASKILFGSDKKNIINIISGITETAKNERDNALSKIDLSVKAVKAARKAYNERGIFSSKKDLFENLLTAIRNDISRRCEYEQLRLLFDALETAKAQLLVLYRDFFEKYSSVINDLKMVFVKNKEAISKLQDVNSDPFMLPLFKISEVRDTLEAVVNKLGIDSAVDSFNTDFYRAAYDVWHGGSEDDVSKWISKYMSNEFRQYIELSLDDHIKNLYPDLANNEDISPLVKKVRDDIIMNLDNMASELFLLDAVKAPRVSQHIDTLTYCSAPATAPIINKAIEQYQVNKPGITKVTGSKDRIFFLKSSPCVPMFAYGAIDNNFAKYMNAQIVTGKHLYEGASSKGDPRDWKTLPDLRPYSIYEHIDWTTPEKIKEAELYGMAENVAGIVHCEIDKNGVDTALYYIWRTPDYTYKIKRAKEKLDEIRELVETDVSNDNINVLLGRLKAALPELVTEHDTLQDYKNSLIDYKFTYGYDAVNNNERLLRPEIPPISIRNDGDHSAEATPFRVRRDHVLSSSVYMHYIKEELEKYEAYVEVMKQIESVINAVKEKIASIEKDIGGRETDQPVFINALLTGVITYSKRHIVLFEDKDDFGIENNPSIELSKPAAAPFGGVAPLYQAFNTYVDLPDSTRNIIHAKVDQRLNGVDDDEQPKDWSDIMKISYDSLLSIFVPEYIQTVALSTKQLPEYANIMNLYRTFLNTQKTFRVMYGL